MHFSYVKCSHCENDRRIRRAALRLNGLTATGSSSNKKNGPESIVRVLVYYIAYKIISSTLGHHDNDVMSMSRLYAPVVDDFVEP